MTIRVVRPDGTITREPFELIGIKANVDPSTFRRKRIEQRQTFVAPTVPPPVQRAVFIDYTVERTKSGKPKGITAAIPGYPEVALPGGAATMLKGIDGLPGWGILASYARGYRMAANGGPAMSPLWEKNEEDKRRKVGETLADPVDCILVRAYAQNAHGLVLLAGQWHDGSWDEGHVLIRPNLTLHKVGWQPSKPREPKPGGEPKPKKRPKIPPVERTTLSEWIERAPTLDVKPDPPDWKTVRRL